MADCHDILIAFEEAISLNKSRCEKLEKSRDALRKKIRKYCEDNGIEPLPTFKGQGSFTMGIANNSTKGSFDLDDGIYFEVEDANEMPTPKTIHGWIVEAVDGHTQQPVIDKNTCVRVTFTDEDNPHHIDLPIYYHAKGDDHPHLAHKRDGWIESDPVEFADWFAAECGDGDQLRRIVRYVKAWKDYKGVQRPKSFVMTTLCALHFAKDDRDDVGLFETLKNIRTALGKEFSCLRPTTPLDEELLTDMDEDAQERFLEALDCFIENAEYAINSDLQTDACKYWKRSLGNVFPCDMASEDSDATKRMAAPAFVKTEGRSA